MQNNLMHIFVQLGQRALEKSRAYYYPLSTNTEEEGALSDAAFVEMLKEIDAFSEQFRVVETASEARQTKAE